MCFIFFTHDILYIFTDINNVKTLWNDLQIIILEYI